MEKLPITKLVNNTGQIAGVPANPRRINKDEYAKLIKSVTDDPDFLNHKPLHVYPVDDTYVVLGGNQRLKALKELSYKDVPVTIYDKDTPADVLKARIMKDNAQYGQWDMDMLANEWSDEPLDEWGIDLPDDWLKDEEEVVEDEAPEVSDEPPVSKLGEIYQLGRHRVMCGDSTDKAQVERLMDGAKVDMVFTDPPYGVDYSGRGKNTKQGIENDNLSLEDTDIMVTNALQSAYDVSKEGATCFVWHPDARPYLQPLFENAFLNAGYKLSAKIIWSKKQASMGFQDYRSQHEPCLYGWKGTRKERVSDRTQTTIWESGRDSSYEHPTQKPVFLATTAIGNHNPSTVLDLFLGSGSTLIACEQTGRTCYGMELDPKYVDVIRKRYHKFVTGSEEGWEDGTKAI